MEAWLRVGKMREIWKEEDELHLYEITYGHTLIYA